MTVSLKNLRLDASLTGAGIGLKLAVACNKYLQVRERDIREITQITGEGAFIVGEGVVKSPASKVALKVASWIVTIGSLPLIAFVIAFVMEKKNASREVLTFGDWVASKPELALEFYKGKVEAILKALERKPLETSTVKADFTTTLSKKLVAYTDSDIEERANTLLKNPQEAHLLRDVKEGAQGIKGLFQEFSLHGFDVGLKRQFTTYIQNIYKDKIQRSVRGPYRSIVLAYVAQKNQEIIN